MKKLSYYQRKKLENETIIKDLTKQIITLVENNNIEEVTLIKIRWKIKLDIDNQLMQGDFI